MKYGDRVYDRDMCVTLHSDIVTRGVPFLLWVVGLVWRNLKYYYIAGTDIDITIIRSDDASFNIYMQLMPLCYVFSVVRVSIVIPTFFSHPGTYVYRKRRDISNQHTVPCCKWLTFHLFQSWWTPRHSHGKDVLDFNLADGSMVHSISDQQLKQLRSWLWNWWLLSGWNLGTANTQTATSW